MNKRSFFSGSFFLALSAGALVSLPFLTGCQDEQLVDGRESDTVTFEALSPDQWVTDSSTRSGSGVFAPDTSYTVKLDELSENGKPVYLHVQVIDGIDSSLLDNMASALPDSTDESGFLADRPCGLPATRGVKVSSISSFGVSAVNYSQFSPTGPFNLMENKQVVCSGGTGSTDVKWPVSGSVSFYAYAPYHTDASVNKENFKISNVRKNSSSEGLSFDLEMNEKTTSAETVDLLVASSKVSTGDSRKPANLNFQHALSAVQVRTSENFYKGTFEEIKLTNVVRKATAEIGKNGPGTFDWTLDEQSRGTLTLLQNGSGITDKNTDLIQGGCFFVIPQYPNQNNQSGSVHLNIKFKPEGVSQSKISNLDLYGTGKIAEGKTHIFTLSNSPTAPDPKLEYTLEAWDSENQRPIESEIVLGYGTTNKKLEFQSYSTVIGGNGTQTHEPWTADYSTDNGATWQAFPGNNGAFNKYMQFLSWSQNKPGVNDNIIINAYTDVGNPVWGNPEEETLKNGEFKGLASSPYNLATHSQGTGAAYSANCYVVNGPGYYCIPLVYGNLIKGNVFNKSSVDNGTNDARGGYLSPLLDHAGKGIHDGKWIVERYPGQLNKVELLWQDVPELVTNIRLANIQGEQNRYLSFDIPSANIKQGNAVIALKNTSNAVLWAWHIWVTPYKLDSAVDQYTQSPFTDVNMTNHAGKSFRMMGMPLGHCIGQSASFPESSIKIRIKQEATGGKTKVFTLKRLSYKMRKPGRTPLYQHGRPVPFPPMEFKETYQWEDKCWFTVWHHKDNSDRDGKSGFRQWDDYAPNTAVALERPRCLYRKIRGNYSTWCNDEFRNRWDNANFHTNDSYNYDGGVVKTIYDPCPYGYCMPPAAAFTGLSRDGKNHETHEDYSNWLSPGVNNASYRNDYGVYFYTNPSDKEEDKTIFIPATGFAAPYAGGTTGIAIDYGHAGGNTSHFWTATFNWQSRQAYTVELSAGNQGGFLHVDHKLRSNSDACAVIPMYVGHN